MRLYDIAQEYNQLLQLVDNGELTAEMVADTLESINAEFDAKALNCMMVVAQLDSDSSGIDGQIARLKMLKSSIDSSRENLVEYVKAGMLAVDKDKLDLGLFKLSIRKATVQLGAVDESKVPAKFWVTIPESKRLDRAALLAVRKLEEIEGVELGESKRSLQIK